MKLHRYRATIRGSKLPLFLVYFAVSLLPFGASRQPNSKLLVRLVFLFVSATATSLPIVNLIFGLDLSLNEFESTEWSSNHLSSRTALPGNCLRLE